MLERVCKLIFLIELIVSEVIRYPHRRRHRREWRRKELAESRLTAADFALDMLSFTGSDIIPLVYVLTSRLDFADYGLPRKVRAGAGLIGTATFAGALWLLRRSHADLGRNWTPTLQLTQDHALVTEGVYRHVRHPIYAALWLWGVAQALLLHNWIAGPAGLVTFLPVYLVRVPREEQMMLDHFGEAYRAYTERTGRVIPRVGDAGSGQGRPTNA